MKQKHCDRTSELEHLEISRNQNTTKYQQHTSIIELYDQKKSKNTTNNTNTPLRPHTWVSIDPLLSLSM